jgi:hypothetical protein
MKEPPLSWGVKQLPVLMPSLPLWCSLEACAPSFEPAACVICRTSNSFGKYLFADDDDAEGKAGRDKIDEEITHPGMPCRQRHLQQFNPAAKNKRAKRQTTKRQAVGDGKHPGGQREGGEVLKLWSDSGHRTLGGWHDGKNYDCQYSDPGKDPRRDLIVPGKPFEASVLGKHARRERLRWGRALLM